MRAGLAPPGGGKPLVAELELRQPVLVSLQELVALAEEAELRTSAKVIAARLRATGWLLPTGQRGIYESAPGAHAGPYDSNPRHPH